MTEPTIMSLEQVRQLHEYYSTGSWWKDARVGNLCATVEELYGALKAWDAFYVPGEECRCCEGIADTVENNHGHEVDCPSLLGHSLIAQLERKEKP